MTLIPMISAPLSHETLYDPVKRKPRPRNIDVGVLDLAQFRTLTTSLALGWRPRIDLETVIPQTYEWCPKRPRHRRRVRGDGEEGQGSICSSQAFLALAILTPPAPSERREVSLMFIGGVGAAAPANAGRINTQYTSGCTLIRISGYFRT
jgi:hypothetical protein